MHFFIELPTFSRYREGYFDDDALLELQGYLLAQPTAGDVVPGTGGVRKLRWARAGMGKRGGVRVCTTCKTRRDAFGCSRFTPKAHAKTSRTNC